jgi:hypothetical protein
MALTTKSLTLSHLDFLYKCYGRFPEKKATCMPLLQKRKSVDFFIKSVSASILKGKSRENLCKDEPNDWEKFSRLDSTDIFSK